MRLPPAVTTVAFWLAALLPLVYLPVLLLGVDSATRFSLFVGLLGLNALALVLGHDYPATRRRRPS